MHTVIVAQFVTLDGVVEDPDGSGGTPQGGWAFRYGPGPVSGDKFHLGAVLDTGVTLLGRTTRELFRAALPDPRRRVLPPPGRDGKLVVSRSVTDTGRWANSTARPWTWTWSRARTPDLVCCARSTGGRGPVRYALLTHERPGA